MLNNLKKCIVMSSTVIMVSLISLSNINVYARANESEQTDVSIQSNIGVSFISPEEADMQRGTSVPSNVWNVSSSGKCEFRGSSHFETLYSNYKFTGKNNYKVYVNNTGDYPITVTAKRSGKTYAMVKITAGKSGSFEFSNIQSDTKFYLVFKNDDGNGYAFNGYVK